MRFSWVLLLASGGCDDTIFPTHVGSGGVGDATGWCAVQSMLQSSCVGCHSAGAAVAGLDLETSPHTALLEWASPSFDGPLVTPGSPETSALVHKLEGTATVGGMMPPSGYLGDERVLVVAQWIAEGADDTCTAPVTGGGGGYHPAGWADPASHGMAAKLQEDACLTCHGADLRGGDVGIACADCHDQVVDDWTTTCTFCHGDPADGSGAPPEDIDDNRDPATITFPAHRVHLSSPMHADWSCEQCHVRPTSVFSEGHVLVGDATPGRAELRFGGGLSPAGRATATGCSDLYCHGDGRSPGSVGRRASVSCGECHPVQQTPGRWDELSGPHERHLDEGIRCADCHPTVDAEGRIVQPAAHVDGRRTVAPTSGIVRSGDGRCTGACHGETHSSRAWVD